MKPRIKQICTALNRLKRSRGFGVHSPFAFHFITKVLKERLPYYAYSELDAKRTATLRAGKASMPTKSMRLIFRVVNYFNPQMILQSASSCGLDTASALSVSSASQLLVFGIDGEQKRLFDMNTAEFSGRINIANSAAKSIDDYKKYNNDLPFIIITDVACDDIEILDNYLTASVIHADGVIIMLNINTNRNVAQLWNRTTEAMESGMAFSNWKTGIIVCSAKLPLQYYPLWF